jgi:hypothetical protein
MHTSSSNSWVKWIKSFLANHVTEIDEKLIDEKLIDVITTTTKPFSPNQVG